MFETKAIFASSLIVALSLTACADDRPATSVVVSAATGGTVSLGNTELAVPAMALANDTEIMLTTANKADFPELTGAQPDVVRIEPLGTTLEFAATLVIDVSGAPSGASLSAAQLREIEGEMVWTTIATELPVSNGLATVSITTFAPLAIVSPPVVGGGNVIRGTISWGDGSPAANAPIELYVGETKQTEILSDSQGAFQFADVSAGSYSLRVNYECTINEAVEVSASEPTVVTLTLCGSSAH